MLGRAIRIILASVGMVILPLGAASAQRPSPLCRTGCGGDGYSVSVTPDGGSGGSHAAYTGPYTLVFTIQNTGTSFDTFDLTCTTTLGVTCSHQSTGQVGLASEASATDTVTFSTAAPGSGIVKLTARGEAGDENDAGTYNVSVTIASGAPLIDSTAMSFTSQNDGRCTQSCFAATYAQSTVPYFSLDAPRSITLQYNGDRVNPHPIVLVNVKPDPTYGSNPTQLQLSVRVDGTLVTFVNGEQTMHFAFADTAWHRLGGQFDGSSYSTGAHTLEVDVASLFSGGTLIYNVYTTRLIIVNDNSSPIAKGWTLAGTQRLFPQSDGSVLITAGDGSAEFFKVKPNSGNCSFFNPPGDFTSMGCNSPSGWRRIYQDSSVVTFNSAGYISAIIGRFNDTTSFAYDGSNRVTTVIDPIHVALRLAYGTNGLSTITDTGGRVTSFTEDAGGRMTAIKDPDSVSTKFGYDANSRLDSITDRRGFTTILGYDQAWKLDSVKAPQIKICCDTSVTPLSQQSAWQKVGVPYSATSVTPASMPRADTIEGSTTQAGGAVTRFTVNRWGEPVITTDPLARTTTVTYDANGLPIRLTEPGGAVDSTVYNGNGLPTMVQAADSTNRRFMIYGAYGQVDSSWGGPHPTARAYLGVDGRVDSMRVAAESTTERFTYDVHGRVVTDTDVSGNLILKRVYGGLYGNTSIDSGAGGLVITHYQDILGRDTTALSTFTIWRRHFDTMNRPTKQYATTDTVPVSTAYDSAGNVVSVTDQKGQVLRFTYNALGWMTGKTDATGRADSLKYSRDGDMVRWVNRRNQALSIAYDALHRRTSKTGGNTDTDRWGYSADGRTLTITDPLDTETTYLNVRGTPDSVKVSMGGQVYLRRYHYTSLGLPDTMSVTGGGISFKTHVFSYDPKTLALSAIGLKDPTGGIATTTIAQTTSTRTSLVTYSAGDYLQREYDGQGSVASITGNAPWAAAPTNFLVYNRDGSLAFKINDDEQSGSQYTYDTKGHLTSDSTVSANSPPPGCTPPQIIGDNGVNCLEGYGGWTVGSGVSFNYDAVGNRIDMGGSYTTGNRIAAFGSCTYATSDSAGDVTSRTCNGQTTTFVWTAEARLDTVTLAGLTIGYHYDALGRLIRKDVNGSASNYYLWDGDNLLAELSSPTQLLAEYSYYSGEDNLHAIIFGGRIYYAQTDALGNVAELTDSVGGIPHTARTYQYNDWGAASGPGIDSVGFGGADRARWKGALNLGTEAGLYYMRSRWYEPATGRFLSEDPEGLDAGTNLYAYSGSDPVNGSDPSGLDGDLCPAGTHLVRFVIIKYDDNTGVALTSCADDITGQITVVISTPILAPITVTAHAPDGVTPDMSQSPIELHAPQAAVPMGAGFVSLAPMSKGPQVSPATRAEMDPFVRRLCSSSANTVRNGWAEMKVGLFLAPIELVFSSLTDLLPGFRMGSEMPRIPLVSPVIPGAVYDFAKKGAARATSAFQLYQNLGC